MFDISSDVGRLAQTALLTDEISLVLTIQLDQPPNDVNHPVLGRSGAGLVDASPQHVVKQSTETRRQNADPCPTAKSEPPIHHQTRTVRFDRDGSAKEQ